MVVPVDPARRTEIDKQRVSSPPLGSLCCRGRTVHPIVIGVREIVG